MFASPPRCNGNDDNDDDDDGDDDDGDDDGGGDDDDGDGDDGDDSSAAASVDKNSCTSNKYAFHTTRSDFAKTK